MFEQRRDSSKSALILVALIKIHYPQMRGGMVMVCVGVCVYQNIHSYSKVRTFWGREDIFCFLRLGLEFGLGYGCIG